MKKNRKRYILIIVFAFVLLGIIILKVLDDMKYKRDTERAKIVAEQYVSEKYNTKMVYHKIYRSAFYPMYHVNFSPMDDSEINFTVFIDSDDFTPYYSDYCSDDYILNLFCRKLEREIDFVPKKIWTDGAYVVILKQLEVPHLPEGVDENSTLEELGKAIPHSLTVYIGEEYPEGNVDGEYLKMYEFINELKNMPMKFYFRRIRFYYLDKDFYIEKWEDVHNVDDMRKLIE